jgi:hypothetical protein
LCTVCLTFQNCVPSALHFKIVYRLPYISKLWTICLTFQNCEPSALHFRIVYRLPYISKLCNVCLTFQNCVPSALHFKIVYRLPYISKLCTVCLTFQNCVPSALHFKILYRLPYISKLCTVCLTFQNCVPSALHFKIIHLLQVWFEFVTLAVVNMKFLLKNCGFGYGFWCPFHNIDCFSVWNCLLNTLLPSCVYQRCVSGRIDGNAISFLYPFGSLVHLPPYHIKLQFTAFTSNICKTLTCRTVCNSYTYLTCIPKNV